MMRRLLLHLHLRRRLREMGVHRGRLLVHRVVDRLMRRHARPERHASHRHAALVRHGGLHLHRRVHAVR